ncbi:glycosyltransferase [Mycolicibacterium psychrotolerans]|uniref:Glycosyl transferase n=1 Tax=Mycolicibacterium psychrotolerans TaxID=216929 RepID=A0A7I7M599_9MYCO|nr:glycosyltransferase [Mycolicibacterium psychrotolerans]BBX66619.1 glycosyl transferase [Mycolicibacterium psychrotolerans]
MSGPLPVFTHLLHLTDHRATFEHALLTEPRREHGYCVDDMARVLIVATREPGAAGPVNGLAGKALTFLNDAQSYDGRCRNRMDSAGRWQDLPSTEDHWGRMVWALGTAAAHSEVGLVRRLATVQFERAAQTRSPHPRARAFAAIGAAELLSVAPGHTAARELLTGYVATLPDTAPDPEWPWPEPRLEYANAVLAEAMIAAGVALDDAALLDRGLDLLDWLLDLETRDGHLSPTPVTGRGPSDLGPGFDQQPIEVASLADACARAAAADARPAWLEGLRMAAGWFGGDNDLGLPMWDSGTGGGYDGLHADRVNLNQGAESTLAALSTMQQARRYSPVRQ